MIQMFINQYLKIGMKQEIRLRMNKTDYYQILDLKKQCTSEDIKKSYKKLALQFHPDKNTHEGAKEIFNKITNAYSKLSNKESKAEYDEKTNKGNKNNYNQFGNFREYPSRSRYTFKKQQKQEDYQFKGESKRKKKQFDKQTEEMQKQFAKFFTKYFENVNKTKQKMDKERDLQKNREKQNIEKKKRQYIQEKRQQQRRKRIQREQEKKRNFIIGFFIVFLAIMFGPRILGSLRQKPLYSLNQTNYHAHKMTTQKLNLTYYVSDLYIKIEIPKQKKEKIDELVDKKYVTNLRKQCLMVQNERRMLEERAFKQKKKKKKQKFLERARNVNDLSCNILIQLSQLNPEYMKIMY